ncbi:MAG: phosphatidate cytidylyltransferase [Deltaproteobacteria bacterium]|nr:phosphatidate cytidylyltransferase [Deltaproteobacteria bacterium]
MHLKRWLTAIIAIPLVLYLLGPAPRWAFQHFLFLVSVLGLLEFYRISSPETPRSLRVVSLILAYPLFYFISRGPLVMILPAASLWVMVPAILFLFLYRSQRANASEGIGKMLFGFFYVCLPLSLLIFIERYPRGELWIVFLLCVVFSTDTGAYYAGRFLGRHRLYPSISPGKTWEGAVGGFLAGILAAVLVSRILPPFELEISMIGLAAVLSILSQIGDLVESMIKRNHGVKDSGSILPGHGGILDRIDGLLFAIPVLYFFLAWYLP